MSGGRCGTCEWSRESEFNWRNGVCRKFDAGYMADAAFDAVAAVEPVYPLVNLRLEVTREFGCVLWKDKESANG